MTHLFASDSTAVRALAAACAWLALAGDAFAMGAEDVFDKASQSIVIVEIYDAGGALHGSGSGVVVAPGDAGATAGGPDLDGAGTANVVLTNCHVTRGAAAIVVRRNEVRYAAALSAEAPRYDLCQLSVPGLEATPARVGAAGRVRPGTRVYAIGAPEGLELSITEGLISALRSVGGVRVLQSSAPISPGSSGGGLFDDQGHLIGITTFRIGEGQELNFAVSAENLRHLSAAGPQPAALLAGQPAATFAGGTEFSLQSASEVSFDPVKRGTGP